MQQQQNKLSMMQSFSQFHWKYFATMNGIAEGKPPSTHQIELNSHNLRLLLRMARVLANWQTTGKLS